VGSNKCGFGAPCRRSLSKGVRTNSPKRGPLSGVTPQVTKRFTPRRKTLINTASRLIVAASRRERHFPEHGLSGHQSASAFGGKADLTPTGFQVG
jgi:hypothetical protein